MSKMKKMMSLLLAAVMVLSMMTVNVFAADGTITVTNAANGATYNAYKIADVEYSGSHYSYTITSDWENFFTTNYPAETGDAYEGLYDSLFQLDASVFESEVTLATFTAQAKTYAESLTADETIDATGTTVEFTGLDYGYYLVTSTANSGGTCMLTNADPEGEIADKNFIPALSKQVQEDSSSNWLASNTADIGQVVNFKITITCEKAPKNYVLEDVMGNEWELVGDVAVTGDSTVWTAGQQYTINADTDEFEITFDGDHPDVKAIDTNDEIVITYSAKLNKNADIAGTGSNDNKATLTYDGGTKDGTTYTYTFKIPVNKVDGEDNKLAGAKFVLQNKADEYYKQDPSTKAVSWVADIADATEFVSDGSNNIEIAGLDADVYYLTETEAPSGYNMLTEPIKITITDDGSITEFSDGTVKVVNNTGAELPETGGIGTVIFRVGGAALIIVAGALLIAKKRANNI